MTKVKFYEYKIIKEKTDKALDFILNKLQQIVPHLRIEHIGSTSIPGAITKGDVDVQIIVNTEEFNKVDLLLGNHFPRNEGSDHTDIFASFISSYVHVDIGIQLTLKNSEVDHFCLIRDQLNARSDLLEEYNNLKKRFQGKSMSNYRIAKQHFFEKIICNST